MKTKILKKVLPPIEPLTVPVPFNFESGHVQFFTQRKFSETLMRAGYGAPEFINTCFIGGQLTGQVLRNCSRFNDLNAKAADFMAHWMVSGWAFKVKKIDGFNETDNAP